MTIDSCIPVISLGVEFVWQLKRKKKVVEIKKKRWYKRNGIAIANAIHSMEQVPAKNSFSFDSRHCCWIRCVWTCHGQLSLDIKSKIQMICIVHWLSVHWLCEPVLRLKESTQLAHDPVVKGQVACNTTVHCIQFTVNWNGALSAVSSNLDLLLITPMILAMATVTFSALTSIYPVAELLGILLGLCRMGHCISRMRAQKDSHPFYPRRGSLEPSKHTHTYKKV